MQTKKSLARLDVQSKGIKGHLACKKAAQYINPAKWDSMFCFDLEQSNEWRSGQNKINVLGLKRI